MPAKKFVHRARDDIEIDAAGVEHVDLTLIQLLVSATKTAKTSQKRMRLIAVSEPPKLAGTPRILDAAELEAVTQAARQHRYRGAGGDAQGPADAGRPGGPET